MVFTVFGRRNSGPPPELLAEMRPVAPDYTLLVGGAPVADGTELQDGTPIDWTFTASDKWSGVASQSVTVSDATYGSLTYPGSFTTDWAGQLGPHTVTANVADVAGNAKSCTVTVQVATSIESMRKLLDRYKASGELSGPLLPQLSNALDQAKHQLDKGDYKGAADHMQDFLKLLENVPMQPNVSAAARAVLQTDGEALVQQWGGR